MAFPGQMSVLPATETVPEVPNAAGSPGRTWQLFWSLSIPASLVGWLSRTYPTRAAHRVFYARSFQRSFLSHVVPVVWKNSLESRGKGPIRECLQILTFINQIQSKARAWTQIQPDGTAAGMAAYPTKMVATAMQWPQNWDVDSCLFSLGLPA